MLSPIPTNSSPAYFQVFPVYRTSSYNGILKFELCKDLWDVADPITDAVTLARFLVIRMSVFLLIFLRPRIYEKILRPKKQFGFLFLLKGEEGLFLLPFKDKGSSWDLGSDLLAWPFLDPVNPTRT